MIGMVFIVRVEERKIFSLAHREAPVARYRKAPIGRIVIANSIVTINIDRCPIIGAVLRAIVDDEQFPVGKGLRYCAFDGALKKLPSIKGRKHDGKEWLRPANRKNHASFISPMRESLRRNSSA